MRHMTPQMVWTERYEESIIEVDPKHETLSDILNAEQRDAYNEILAAVDSGKGGVFFVDGLEALARLFCTRLYSRRSMVRVKLPWLLLHPVLQLL